jgi:hypothetical protein
MRTQTGRLPMQTPEVQSSPLLYSPHVLYISMHFGAHSHSHSHSQVLPGGEWVKAKPWDKTATTTEVLRGGYVKSRNTGRAHKINGIDGNVSGLLPD